METIVEPRFESLIHKYNWVRWYFASRRRQEHNAPLRYQPRGLMRACKTFPVDTLTDAIETIISTRQSSYFAAFLEELNQEKVSGGWEEYDTAIKKNTNVQD